MKNKKTPYIALCVAAFLLLFAARALSIFHGYIYSDITFARSFVQLVSFAATSFQLISYGICCATVSYAAVFEKPFAIASAAILTGAPLLDKAASIVYDLASSSIGLLDRSTLMLTGLSAAIEVLTFAAAFFAPAVIALILAKKEKKLSALPAIIIPPAAIALSHIGARLYICIDFVLEYNDVTGTEYAQMAGDLLSAFLTYGVVIFLISALTFFLFDRFCTKREKNSDKV